MKVAVFADLHYSDQKNPHLPCRRGEIALELLDSVVDSLNKEYLPDIAICAGDLVNDPERADLLPDVAGRLERLNSPLIVIPGNHDPASAEFYRAVPRPPAYMDIGGIRFIPFTDDPEKPGWNAARTPEEIERMIRTASDFGGPSVSVQHVPLYRPGTSNVRYNYEYAAEIIDAMRDSGVKLTVSGHYHEGMDPVFDGNVTALAAPALCEEPFRFIVFELDRNGALSSYRKICGKRP